MSLGYRRKLQDFLFQVRAINLANAPKKDSQKTMAKLIEESQ